MVRETAKSTILKVLSLLLIIIRSGRLAEIRDPFVFQNPRGVCVSHSPGQTLGCTYTICSYGQTSIFLHNSQWITFPTQSSLVLYLFCANLLHSLIIWLIVSPLSPHNPHMLFRCVLSIFALVWLVLLALFCAAIRRNSVSLLRFPFLSHFHVFSCEMSLVSRLKLPQSYFSSHFCFLVIVVPLVLVSLVLFLVAAVSLPLRFSM